MAHPSERSRDDTHQWDLFSSQSCSQPAINSLEAVLSSEGNVYCEEGDDSHSKRHSSKRPIYRQAQMEILTIPFILGLAGVFFLGPLLLQQRQKPLLLLTRAVHEVIPWLGEQERLNL